MKNQKQVPETNVERFYKWMQAMGNVYLADNEKMVKAFQKVENN